MSGLPLQAQGRTEASNLEVRYVQCNIETDRLDLTVGAGVNNGNTPGGDHGTEGELRGASSALDCIDLRSQGDATERQNKRGPSLPQTAQRSQHMSHVHSKPSWLPFPPFMSIAKFVSDIFFRVILQTNPQETAPVADKLEALISRIIALEELFGTPAGGVVEQKRRDALLRYAIVPPPLDSELSSFQEAPVRRRKISFIVSEATTTATSRWWRCT